MTSPNDGVPLTRRQLREQAAAAAASQGAPSPAPAGQPVAPSPAAAAQAPAAVPAQPPAGAVQPQPVRAQQPQPVRAQPAQPAPAQPTRTRSTATPAPEAAPPRPTAASPQPLRSRPVQAPGLVPDEDPAPPRSSEQPRQPQQPSAVTRASASQMPVRRPQQPQPAPARGAGQDDAPAVPSRRSLREQTSSQRVVIVPPTSTSSIRTIDETGELSALRDVEPARSGIPARSGAARPANPAGPQAARAQGLASPPVAQPVAAPGQPRRPGQPAPVAPQQVPGQPGVGQQSAAAPPAQGPVRVSQQGLASAPGLQPRPGQPTGTPSFAEQLGAPQGGQPQLSAQAASLQREEEARRQAAARDQAAREQSARDLAAREEAARLGSGATVWPAGLAGAAAPTKPWAGAPAERVASPSGAPGALAAVGEPAAFHQRITAPGFEPVPLAAQPGADLREALPQWDEITTAPPVQAASPGAQDLDEEEDDDEDYDEPDHRYTWLHYLILVAVAFVLGLIIWKVGLDNRGVASPAESAASTAVVSDAPHTLHHL